MYKPRGKIYFEILLRLDDLRKSFSALEEKLDDLRKSFSALEEKSNYQYHKLLQLSFEQAQGLKPILHLLRSKPFKAKDVKRIGSDFDGGYYLPNIDYKDKVLISVGIGTNLDFELQSSSIFGKIICVDPNLSIHFSKVEKFPNVLLLEKAVGIAPGFVSIQDLISMSSNQGIVFKCDVEGAELDFLQNTDFGEFDLMILEIHGLLSENLISTPMKIKNLLEKIHDTHEIILLTGNNSSTYGLIENVWVPDVFEVVAVSKAEYAKFHPEKDEFLYKTLNLPPNDPSQSNPSLNFNTNWDLNANRY
jgi:hypothetical protein